MNRLVLSATLAERINPIDTDAAAPAGGRRRDAVSNPRTGMHAFGDAQAIAVNPDAAARREWYQ